MKSIVQDSLQQSLKIYKPEKIYLKEARVGYPEIWGTFNIGTCDYVVEGVEVDHATDIEIQLCLNQLAYAGIAEIIKDKSIPDFREMNFLELQSNNMVIVESRKRFRRPIRTNVDIQGSLEVKEWRKAKKHYIGWLDFQFENKSAIGQLELVIVSP